MNIWPWQLRMVESEFGIQQLTDGLATFRWQKGPIIRVIFSPDGKRLAAAGREELFSLLKTEGDSLKDLPAPKPLKEPSNESEVITTLAFAPKGKLLALGNNGGSVGIWDLGNNKWFAEPMRAHPRAVYSIVFSPNGKWVASGCLEGYVVLWDVERGKQLGGPLKVFEKPSADHNI